MRVVLCSTIRPFVFGGARFIAEWLEEKLREHGHEVEKIYLPYAEDAQATLEQMTAFRLIDLSESADRLITFRPPAHVIPHPNKVLWFIHHLREFYDLWQSPFCALPDDARGRALRRRVRAADNVAFGESRRVFTNSRVVSERIRKFNHVPSEVLYPPLLQPERFTCESYGDEIVYICRIEDHKRQHLLIEAMRLVKTPVKLRICGASGDAEYFGRLQAMVEAGGLGGRVQLENRWISEDEKVALLANALASAYVAFDEDSYGYPSLEAGHARKAVLTTTDSGGVLELIADDLNGLVCAPEPAALAEGMDRLFRDRAAARRMGEAATRRIHELKIDWNHVVTRILA